MIDLNNLLKVIGDVNTITSSMLNNVDSTENSTQIDDTQTDDTQTDNTQINDTQSTDKSTSDSDDASNKPANTDTK